MSTTAVPGVDVIDVEAMGGFPDAIAEMLTGRRKGLLVRGAFSPDACETLVSRMESERALRGRLEPLYIPVPQERNTMGEALLDADAPLVYGSLIFGTPLILATRGQGPTHYLENARRFRELVERCWELTPGFEERFTKLLERVAGGRRVAPILHEGGDAFAPLHIKGIEERGGLAIHCGNETHNRDLLELLSQYIDVKVGQISYLVLLRKPTGGGGLRVYDLEWTSPDGQRVQNANRTASETIALCESHGFADLDPEVGDVILFDGGRYFHRVNEITGATSRWTAQGFLALSHDHETIHYWF